MAFDAILKLGPMVLLAGSVAMIVLYFSSRKASLSNRTPSFAAYIGVALFVGILAYAAGTATGIYMACSSADPGNLCGLYGVFGVGPMLSGLALFIYALFWANRARHAA
jgi:hypothetical protein